MNPLKFNDSEADLIRALVLAKVEFVVIGGHAVHSHGFSRPIGDLDILIAPNSENASRIKAALAAVNFTLTADLESRIAQPQANCVLPSPFHSQLLGHIAGVETNSALQDIALAPFGPLTIPVLSLANLIATKKAVGRPKDLTDLQGLAGV